MRVLLVGAGGVGTALARTAARREALRAHRGGRLLPRRVPSGPHRPSDDRFEAVALDASDEGAIEELLRAKRCDVLVNAIDPRFVMPLFNAALHAGVTYLDMAMSLSHPHPERSLRPRPGSSSATSSSPSAAAWEARGQLALVGMGVEPGLSDVFARYAADHLFSHDRRDRGARRCQPRGRGLRLRSHLLDLDHDRGVPEPAGHLGARPGLVHHRALQRARGLRVPRRHRRRRVRQRRARGGPPRAALGRRRAGHVQVRPGRGVHRGAEDAAQARSRLHGTGEGR